METYGLGITQRGDSLKGQGFVKVIDRLKEIQNAWIKVGSKFKMVLEFSERRAGQWKEKWVVNRPVPIGTIIAWAGSQEEIPSGWYLCDGNNGTPNLIDRFVMGGASPGKTGGSATHTHTLTTAGSHTHSSVLSKAHRHSTTVLGDDDYTKGDNYSTTEGSHSHSLNSGGSHNHGGTNPASNEPPYYSLAFIMKGGEH